MSASFLSAMNTRAEDTIRNQVRNEQLKKDLDYLREYGADDNDIESKKKRLEELAEMDSEGEEEVRSFCPDCYGEGWCHVSTRRAMELEILELNETCCPFGCAASEEDSDSDSDSEDGRDEEESDEEED